MPIQTNRTGGINKKNSNRKGKIKLFLFVENIIIYLKDPKNSTKNS
jgi:hypothetical protein